MDEREFQSVVLGTLLHDMGKLLQRGSTGLVAEVGMQGQVEQLDVSTLIPWRGRDPYQKIEYGRRLAKTMQLASLEVCADGGHFLPEDRPDRVAVQIRAFLLPTPA